MSSPVSVWLRALELAGKEVEFPEDCYKGQYIIDIARDMLARLIVRANGAVVFTAEFRNATSANPYLVFFLRIERTTELAFTWLHEDGRSLTAAARIVVA